MRINHNLASLNTYRQMSLNTTGQAKSLEKLSSGLRINKAGDDAAGLAISEKMRGQIRGLNQASRNSQDAISMIQTAEGGLNEVHDILQRMRELSVQASNSTMESDDRTAVGNELVELKEEIDRISDNTEFNGKSLLNGSLSTSVDTANSEIITGTFTGNSLNFVEVDVSGADAATSFIMTTSGADVTMTAVSAGVTVATQTVTLSSGVTTGTTKAISFGELGVSLSVTADTGTFDTAASLAAELAVGANDTIRTGSASASATFAIGANAGQEMSVSFADMGSDKIGTDDLTNSVGAKISDNTAVDTVTKAQDLITILDDAINEVSSQRGVFGAAQNRLEHTIRNLDTSAENLQASESRIRDVDMAKEMMEFTKNNILVQAAQSMLAQANQQPQGVLGLLR